jgi:hypothetical protein
MARALLLAALAACSSSKPGGGDHDTVTSKPGDTQRPAGGGAAPFTTARDAFGAAAASAMGVPADKVEVTPAAENVVNTFTAYDLGDLRAFQGDHGHDAARGWASSDGKAVVVWGGQPHGDLGLVGKAAGLLDPKGKPAADVAAALVWAQGLGWEPTDPPTAPAITRKDGGTELTFAAVWTQMGGLTRRMHGSFQCDARYACTLTLSPAP